MPTEAETRVLRLLAATEIPDNAGTLVEERGNADVTVLCEAALGAYAGLPFDRRLKAIYVLGQMNHVQAMESVPLLVGDPDMDVAVTAIRAAARQKNGAAGEVMGQRLANAATHPIVAAECVKALRAMNTAEAGRILERYESASPDSRSHRGSELVQKRLRERRK